MSELGCQTTSPLPVAGETGGPTLLSGLSDDVGGALAHHLGDVKRAVGLIGHRHWAVHSLSLDLQTSERKKRWDSVLVVFFLCHWGGQMTQVLVLSHFNRCLFAKKHRNASGLTRKPGKICSNLLGMAQHVSLWPSDALFQNPALLLKRAHCRNAVSFWCHFTIEIKVKTSYLSNNVSVLSVNLSNGPQVTDHTEHLVYLPWFGTNICIYKSERPWVT